MKPTITYTRTATSGAASATLQLPLFLLPVMWSVIPASLRLLWVGSGPFHPFHQVFYKTSAPENAPTLNWANLKTRCL